MVLADFPVEFLRGFAILFGLLWGSFLNVVIYRVPLGMSVSRPPSHCPTCKKPVRPWHNVPVLAYVLLRGKSACCKERIPLRYPIIELIGGVLALGILELLVLTLPAPTTSIAYGIAVFASSLSFALGLVATAFIDIDHRVILPDRANAVGALLGVATATFRGLDWKDALIGVVVGAGLGLGINGLYKGLRGRSGFATGDTVLLAVLGAWFGYAGALFGLFAGAIQSVLILLILFVSGAKFDEPEAVKREREAIEQEIAALPEEEREQALKEWREDDELAVAGGSGLLTAIPFGPFIAIAGLELLLFGSFLRDLFWVWMQP